MIVLQKGHTTFHGRPGGLESVVARVPSEEEIGWEPPHYPEESPVLDYSDEEVAEARENGKIWAEYEATARELGRSVVEKAASNTVTSSPGNHYRMPSYVHEMRMQEGLHHLVAAALHKRDE